MIESTKHFSKKELQCKCGCGVAKMDEHFMELIEMLRFSVGLPLTPTSAYRCLKHNTNIGSKSPVHTMGLAMDIQCSGDLAHRVLTEAMPLGFTGVGISQRGNHSDRFIHLDSYNDELRPWVWSY